MAALRLLGYSLCSPKLSSPRGTSACRPASRVITFLRLTRCAAGAAILKVAVSQSKADVAAFLSARARPTLPRFCQPEQGRRCRVSAQTSAQKQQEQQLHKQQQHVKFWSKNLCCSTAASRTMVLLRLWLTWRLQSEQNETGDTPNTCEKMSRMSKLENELAGVAP